MFFDEKVILYIKEHYPKTQQELDLLIYDLIVMFMDNIKSDWNKKPSFDNACASLKRASNQWNIVAKKLESEDIALLKVDGLAEYLKMKDEFRPYCKYL